MARKRLLNPLFFVDPDIAMVSFPARLLFQSLWCLADREGRLEDKPQRIRVQTFPFDQGVNIDGHLAELVEQDFIIRYAVDGKAYIQIRAFATHQKPHQREAPSVIPPPPARHTQGTPEHSLSPAGSAEPGGNRYPVAVPESAPDPETEQSVTVDPKSERRSDSLGSPDGMPPIDEYGAAIVDEWRKLRGADLPESSNKDFLQLQDWHGSGIPLRIVLRGIADCIEVMKRRKDKPQGKPLAYYNSAVRQAHSQWRKAIA